MKEMPSRIVYLFVRIKFIIRQSDSAHIQCLRFFRRFRIFVRLERTVWLSSSFEKSPGMFCHQIVTIICHEHDSIFHSSDSTVDFELRTRLEMKAILVIFHSKVKCKINLVRQYFSLSEIFEMHAIVIYNFFYL